MLTQPLVQQLHDLRLNGMAATLERQLESPDRLQDSFEDRLTGLLQQELVERASARLAQRLRWAKLPLPACLEDLDTRTPRGIDRGQLGQLTELGWIGERLNLLITGPTGVGKSFIASALAHAACRADFSVRCFRLPRLVEEIARYAAMQKRSALYRQLAKVDLIVIDDFGLTPLASETVRDLLEILDDRYDRKSTLITSQMPVDQWHAYLGDRTVADAILDRLVHNSYRLVLKGESMRKRRNATTVRTSTKAKPLTQTHQLHDSPITASHWPGIVRNTRPASAGIGGLLHRNTHEPPLIRCSSKHASDNTASHVNRLDRTQRLRSPDVMPVVPLGQGNNPYRQSSSAAIPVHVSTARRQLLGLLSDRRLVPGSKSTSKGVDTPSMLH